MYIAIAIAENSYYKYKVKTACFMYAYFKLYTILIVKKIYGYMHST